jgi:hypothetical protein
MIDIYKLDIRRYILYKGTVTCVCVCFIGCRVFTMSREERVGHSIGRIHTTVLYSVAGRRHCAHVPFLDRRLLYENA